MKKGCVVKRTKQEICEECREAELNDVTGYTSAEEHLADFLMENDYSKSLQDYQDDDEFYTDYEKIISVDEVEDLYVHDLAVKYVKENGYEKEYKEYLLDNIYIYYEHATSVDTGTILKQFVLEDAEDYIEWIWSIEDEKNVQPD